MHISLEIETYLLKIIYLLNLFNYCLLLHFNFIFELEMNSINEETTDVLMAAEGQILQPKNQSQENAGNEYVMTLIDFYMEEHQRNIELRTAARVSGSQLSIRNRLCLPPMTQPLPVITVLDNKCHNSYRYLTPERGDKLANAVMELLFEDAVTCKCSNQNDCSSYSEVMSVFAAGAQAAFGQLHNGYDVRFSQGLIHEKTNKIFKKYATRRLWQKFCQLCPMGKAINVEHTNQINVKSKKIPKPMQVKYIRNN